MSPQVFWLFSLCFVLVLRFGEAYKTSQRWRHIQNRERLHEDIFKNYSSNVRPSENKSVPLNLWIGFDITNLHWMSVWRDTHTVGLLLDKRWRDVRLMWDPKKYGNITEIRVKPSKLWLPDIVVYNRRYGYISRRELAYLSYTGDIHWEPVAIFWTHCPMDVTNFPFDTQSCELVFGSWAYSGNELNISLLNDTVGKAGFFNNRGWDLLKTTVVRNEVTYECCPGDTYVSVSVRFFWKRKSTMACHILILPASFIALIIPFIFLLPPNCKHKVTLGVFVIVAMILVELELRWWLPGSAPKPPLVATYVMMITGMSTVALVLSVIVISLTERGLRSNRAPLFARNVLLRCLKPMVLLGDTHFSILDGPTLRLQGIDNPGAGSDGSDGKPQELSQEDRQKYVVQEWRLMGMVVDRLVFGAFIVVFVIAVIVLFI